MRTCVQRKRGCSFMIDYQQHPCSYRAIPAPHSASSLSLASLQCHQEKELLTQAAAFHDFASDESAADTRNSTAHLESQHADKIQSKMNPMCELMNLESSVGARKKSIRDASLLIPPKAAHLQDKLTVVLDLDETLVYARAGPLYVRPGIEHLLSFLRDNCETIVWTAGVNRYANAVVSEIDKHCVVSHTIARDSRWTQQGSKDVKLLNRDLDRLILIDNTPDAIRGNERNSILVEDYEGGELEDTTLSALVDLLRDLTNQMRNGVTVPEYIQKSHRVLHLALPTDAGEMMMCPCLARDYNSGMLK